MTIAKVEHYFYIIPKLLGQPLKFSSYTHAAAASQPKPCLVIIG